MSLYGNITNPINTQFVFDKIYPNKHLMDKKIDSDNIFYNKFVLISYDEDPEFLEIEYTIDKNKSNYENNYEIDKINEDNNNGLGWDKTVWQKTLINGKSTYRKIATLNNQMPNLVIKADAPLGIGESLDNNWDYNLSEQSSLPVYNLSIPAPWKFALKDDKIEYFQDKFKPETAISENEDKLTNTFDFKSKVSISKEDEDGNSYIDYEDPSDEKKADTQLLTINLPSIGNAIAKVWEHLYGPIPEGQEERILKIRPNLIANEEIYNSISEGDSVASVINQAYDVIGQKLIKVYETKESIPSEEKDSSYIYYISNEEKFYRYVNNQNKKGFELLSSTNEELISLLTMLLIFRREIDNLQDSTKVYKIIDSNNEYFSDGHSLIGISFGSIVEKMVDYEPYKYYQIIKNDDIEKYEIINQENLTDENSLKQGYDITFTDVKEIKFFEDNTYYIKDGDIYKFAQKDEKNQYLDTYYAKNEIGEYNYIYKENTYYYKDSDDSYQLFNKSMNEIDTLYSITSTLQHVYIVDGEQKIVQTGKYYYKGGYNINTPITNLEAADDKIIYLTDGDIKVGTADIFVEYSSDFYYKNEGAFYKGSNPSDPNWLNNQYNYYKLEQINDFSKEKLALDSTELYLQENNEYKKYEGDSGNLESLDLIKIDWISPVLLRNWSSNQYYYMPNNEYYQLDKSSDYTKNINYYEINTQQNKTLVTFYEKGKYYILDPDNQIYNLAEDETVQKDKTYTTHNVQLREIQLRGIEQDNPESDDNNNPNKDIVITKDNEKQTKQINIAHRKINPQKNDSLTLTPTGFIGKKINSETGENIELNAKLILENNDNGHIVSYSDSFELDVPRFKESLQIQKKILSAQLKIHDKDKKIWKIQHNALKDFISESTRQEILPAKEIDSASLKTLRSLDLQEAIDPSFDRTNGIIYLLSNGTQEDIDDIESKVFNVRVIIENGYDIIKEEQ